MCVCMDVYMCVECVNVCMRVCGVCGGCVHLLLCVCQCMHVYVDAYMCVRCVACTCVNVCM